MIRRLVPLTLLALGAAACGGGAPTTATGGDTGDTPKGAAVTIGTLHPLTGALAVDGQQMSDAAKLAAEEINAAGGIESLGGAELVIAAADTQGKPEVAQSEAQRLIQGGAAAIVGPYQSAVASQIAAVAERSTIPFVIDVATADSILAQGYTYTFRIQPNASVMGAKGAQYMMDVAKDNGTDVKKVGYLHEQTEFGTTVMKAFVEEARKQGVTVDPVISYDAFKASDLTTEVTRVKEAGVDVLAVTGYYRDGLLIAKNVDSVKPSVKAVLGVANGAFDLPQFPTDFGAGADGYLDANYHADVTKPEYEDLAEKFKAKYGAEIRTPAVLTYEAVRLIAAGLEEAGSADRTELRDAIAGLSFETIMANDGPVVFNEQGENENAVPILMQVQSGEVKQVFPEEFAQAKPVFPATK
jgi:branched-chain amino acid transport system substrate-binding protein